MLRYVGFTHWIGSPGAWRRNGNNNSCERNHSHTRRTDPSSVKRSNTVWMAVVTASSRIQAHLAVFFAPHQAHWQPAS